MSFGTAIKDLNERLDAFFRERLKLRRSGVSDIGKKNPSRPVPLQVEITGRTTSEERAKEKKQEHELTRRIAFWTMITGVGTVVAAILAGFAACIFWNQLRTMQSQLKAQEADFQFDQRPIMALSDHPLPDHRDGLQYNSAQQFLFSNYSVKNFGKGTAFEVLICDYSSVLGGPFVPGSKAFNVVDVIPTQIIWGTTNIGEGVSLEQEQRIEHTDQGLVVKYVLKYKDAFKTPYSNTFCLTRYANGSVGYGTCSASQIGNRQVQDAACENSYR